MNLSPIRRAGATQFEASNYADWSAKAQAHDVRSGKAKWRATDATDLYDYKSIARRLATLRAFRAAGDDKALLYALNEGIHGNMDGMGNERLYQEALDAGYSLDNYRMQQVFGAFPKYSQKTYSGNSVTRPKHWWKRLFRKKAKA